ncbi:MAG: ATP-binding cassette domain-containing protein [Bacteroidota bacterium]
MSDIVLNLNSVSLELGGQTILDKVNMHLQKGDFAYLVGRTGVGKSSLLKLIYGDLKMKEGNISLGSMNVGQVNHKTLPQLRRSLGIVFQDYQLLPDRSVSQNIQFALKATGWRKNALIKKRTSEVLMQVGMTGKAHDRPHTLSGGQQQRISIARALINEPVLLIADEPTGNLDPQASFHLMKLMKQINNSGTTILMATHEYSLIRNFPGMVFEIENGKLIEYPEAEDFFKAYRKRFERSKS